MYQKADVATFNEEYGCLLRRIAPAPDFVDESPWGTAWVRLAPGKCTDPHAHDEDEMFIILSGVAQMKIGDEASPMAAGDVVRIPRNEVHSIANPDPAEELQFLSIYWGGTPIYTATTQSKEQCDDT